MLLFLFNYFIISVGDRMIKRLNRGGFTLIELLAVLVILSAIMAIALPSITSSLERNKEKQNKSKKEMLESFAEIYVADYKNALYNKLGTETKCYISITTLNDYGYLSDDAAVDSDGNPIDGYINFDSATNSYTYSESSVGVECYKPS